MQHDDSSDDDDTVSHSSYSDSFNTRSNSRCSSRNSPLETDSDSEEPQRNGTEEVIPSLEEHEHHQRHSTAEDDESTRRKRPRSPFENNENTVPAPQHKMPSGTTPIPVASSSSSPGLVSTRDAAPPSSPAGVASLSAALTQGLSSSPSSRAILYWAFDVCDEDREKLMQHPFVRCGERMANEKRGMRTWSSVNSVTRSASVFNNGDGLNSFTFMKHMCCRCLHVRSVSDARSVPSQPHLVDASTSSSPSVRSSYWDVPIRRLVLVNQLQLIAECCVPQQSTDSKTNWSDLLDRTTYLLIGCVEITKRDAFAMAVSTLRTDSLLKSGGPLEANLTAWPMNNLTVRTTWKPHYW